MGAQAVAEDSPIPSRDSRVVVIKPMHLGMAMVLHLIVIIFTIGLFYGTMRTQIDDDRSMIQILVKSNEDLNKSVADLNGEISQLRGQIDTMIRMQASK